MITQQEVVEGMAGLVRQVVNVPPHHHHQGTTQDMTMHPAGTALLGVGQELEVSGQEPWPEVCSGTCLVIVGDVTMLTVVGMVGAGVVGVVDGTSPVGEGPLVGQQAQERPQGLVVRVAARLCLN